MRRVKEWIVLAQDRNKEGRCEHDNEPLGPIQYGGFLN